VRGLGKAGVKVPEGFATTANVYWRYVDSNGLGGIAPVDVELAKEALPALSH